MMKRPPCHEDQGRLMMKRPPCHEDQGRLMMKRPPGHEDQGRLMVKRPPVLPAVEGRGRTRNRGRLLTDSRTG
jgi:hypothetical protein